MNFIWFVEELTLAGLRQAAQIAPDSVGAFFRVAESDSNPIYSVAGDVATIKVEGLMTVRPSFWARYLGRGNTTYAQIEDALTRAGADANVKRIEMHFDTPGGQVDGLYEAMAAIAEAKKPVKAVVGSMAASAGYFLASQADTIVASSPASRVGSVGMRADFYVHDNDVSITNSESPNKAPDVSTPEGKKIVQGQLDAYFDLFIGAVAEGRSVQRKTAVERFGKGDMLLAVEAKKRGMIDAVGDEVSTRGDAPVPNEPSEEPEMAEKITLAILKASHPDVYAEAVAETTNSERGRVKAHLTLGEASGDMATAIKAIQEGSALTPELQASYLAAGMKKTAQGARDGDDTAAGAAADGGESPKAGEDSEAVLALVKARYSDDKGAE